MNTSQNKQPAGPKLVEIAYDEESALTGIGTTVVLREAMAGNPAGSRGVIYAIEIAEGIYYQSVILSNGHDIGSFSPFEMDMSFSITGHTDMTYSFTTVAQLQADFAAGKLNAGFVEPQP